MRGTRSLFRFCSRLRFGGPKFKPLGAARFKSGGRAHFDYSGCNVLVTGSSKGIGLVIASQYARAGANVCIHSRTQTDIDKTVAALKSELGHSSQLICGIAADLTDAAQTKAGIAFVEKEMGHLDVLVNNAGAFFVKEFFESEDSDFLELFEANVMSSVRLSRHFLKRMLEPTDAAAVGDAKLGEIASTVPRKGGNIVNVTSECAVRGLEQMPHYSSSKAAQVNLSRALAKLTVGIENVRVNSLLPGPTWTEGVAAYMQQIATRDGVSLEEAVADYFRTYEPESIKQKFLEPEEIAAVCMFVTSDDAKSIEGASVRCEGGMINYI